MLKNTWTAPLLVEVTSILLQRHFNVNFNITSKITSTRLQSCFSDVEVAEKPFFTTKNTPTGFGMFDEEND